MRYSVKINGMMCNNCEKRVCDVFTRELTPMAVQADHTSGTVTLDIEKSISVEAIKDIVEAMGYDFISAVSE